RGGGGPAPPPGKGGPQARAWGWRGPPGGPGHPPLQTQDGQGGKTPKVTPAPPPTTPPYQVNPAPVKIKDHGSIINARHSSRRKSSRAPTKPPTAAHSTSVEAKLGSFP